MFYPRLMDWIFLLYFQTSEFDSLDWSPATTDNILMGGIDDYFWTSDTLFSTINSTPNLVWPDPREIGE